MKQQLKLLYGLPGVHVPPCHLAVIKHVLLVSTHQTHLCATSIDSTVVYSAEMIHHSPL